MPEIETEIRYGAVGKCIYCSRQDPKAHLSDEHIIPHGLGGKLILPNASCERCRRITNEQVEQVYLRQIMGDFRERYGLRRRKRGPKDRFKLSPMRVETADGIIEIEAPLAANRVDMTALVAFDIPLILKGHPPLLIRNPPIRAVNVVAAIGKDIKSTAQRAHPDSSQLLARTSFHANLFARMLAKIGHAFAAAEIGLENFSPLLPKAILGEEPWLPGYYVGGLPFRQAPSEYHSEIGWRRRSSLDGREFVVVQLRLFGKLGAPIYFIVAGEV